MTSAGELCPRCLERHGAALAPPPEAPEVPEPELETHPSVRVTPAERQRLGRGTPAPAPTTLPAEEIASDTRPKVLVDEQLGSIDHRGSLPVGPSRPNADESVRPGAVLEGKYRLLEEAGRGSMGTVYVAEDVILRRRVAVKFLLPELCESADCADRFRSEAVAMAAIRDENVAQIFTYGELVGTPYFVMEHIDGQTVEAVIDEHNQRGDYVPVGDALDIMWQLLGGLAEIHSSGAVHRDIKPANIMLTGTPARAVILDFGLVRDVRVKNDTVPLAGTPAYIAPELVEGHPGADRSRLVDIYSAGATAYELFTGTIPFSGSNWFEILQKHVTDEPVAPSSRRPELPPEVDQIVLKAMAKDPRERFQGTEEFLRGLMLVEDVAHPNEGQTSRVSFSRPPSRPDTGRRRSPFTAVAPRPSIIGQGRLLVVDPDPEFRALALGTAKATVPGCEVHSVAEGIAALERLGQVKPNVVLIDFSDPEASGPELAAAIRANPDHEQSTIIAVADVSAEIEEEILEWLGVNHFFRKPVEVEALAELLRPLL